MSGVAPVSPSFQFFDSSGNPLVSGKLYVYLAGTTTQTTTWQDQTQLSANTNPIILNAAGRCTIWFDPTLTYKFDLQNSAGVSQPGYPVDNVPGSAAVASLVTFTQAGTGAVPRTAESKMRDLVCVFDFMTTAQISDVQAGTALLDVTTAVSSALTASLNVYFPSGTYKITSGLVLRSGQTIYGDGPSRTIITTAAAIQLLTCSNAIGIGNATYGPRLRDMRIVGTAAALKGLVLQSVYNVELHQVTFSGFLEEQMKLIQVWDSEFRGCYWKDNLAGNTSPAVLLDSGTSDNTNNLRFYSCTWETLRKGAVKSVTSAGGSNNYAIEFYGCKFEGCNAGGAAAAYVDCPAGSSGHVAFRFSGLLIGFLNETQHRFLNGSGLSNSVIEKAYVFINIAYTAPFITLASSSYVVARDINIFGSGSSANTYLIQDSGSNSQIGVEGCTVNGNAIAAGVNTSISAPAFYGPVEYRTNFIEYQKWIRQGTGLTNGTVTWVIDGSGTVQHYNSHSGSNLLNFQVSATGQGTFRNGMNVENGGVTIDNQGWNSGMLRLGPHRLWVDSSDRLRIKNGVPSSDTDGSVVGTQT